DGGRCRAVPVKYGGDWFMAENVRFHVGSGGRGRGRRPISVTVANLQQLGITQPYPEGVARPRAATAWARRYLTTAVAMDVAITIVGFCVAYYLRFGASLTSDLPLFVAAPVAWLGLLGFSGTYNRYRLGNGTEEYRAIGRAALLTFALMAVLDYVTDASLARGFVFPTMLIWLMATVGGHWWLRRRLNARRAQGDSMLNTLVVGREDAVTSMIREFREAPQSGYRIVGACVSGMDTTWSRRPEVEGVPVLGDPEETLEAVDRTGADVVAVSSHPDLSGQPLRRLGWALAERQVELVVAPGIVEVAGPRLSLRPAAGLSMLHVERPADGLARLTVKKVMDYVLAAIITVLVLPVGLAIAAAIKLTSRGPVFFLQERVGEHGRTFQVIKFRSMVADAEQRLESMSRDGQTNAVLSKWEQDPRITPVGRFIRKYSLDELPQLLNVLAGQMSLVGPRPNLSREVAMYESDAIQRLRVLPGMTGLWQISGRSNLTWEESLRLDLWYVDNWSPMLDLQILIGTVRAVLKRDGAY
ncbi:MAG: sugar transferase, partial [Dermatophilaceae bacterium]